MPSTQGGTNGSFAAWLVTALAVAAKIVIAAALLMAGLALLFYLAIFLMPAELSTKLRADIGIGIGPAHIPFELYSTTKDDEAIARRVAQCVGTDDLQSLPPSDWQAFFPGLHDSIGWALHPDGSSKPPKRQPDEVERHLLRLNGDMLDQRMVLYERMETNYSRLQVAKWAAVIVGLITTVLISLSATELGKGDALGPRMLRTFAIIFSALATAVAAISAFYNPDVELGNARRAFAAVKLLQGQIARDLMEIPCSPIPGDQTEKIVTGKKVLTDDVARWEKRYEDILVLAEVGPPVPGGVNKPPSPNGH